MVLLRFFTAEKKSLAAFELGSMDNNKDDPSKKIEKWFKAIDIAHIGREF